MLAHAGQPLAPHDLWAAWNLDPLLIGLLVGAWALHRSGRRRSRAQVDRCRARAFVIGLGVVAMALLSPLEAMSGSLASAHMVQHVLLMLVAAPLLAFSAPGSVLLRGAPVAVRRAPGAVRRRLRLSPALRHGLGHPVTALLAYVGTLWTWHASAAYDATLRSELVHGLEHATFLASAVLFWSVIVAGRRGRRVVGGAGLLLVFGAAMASVLLAVLMTFASAPWYRGYATSTSAWGLDHLADQHLAGVLMWVPAGLLYVGTALVVFWSWLESWGEDATRESLG